MTPVISLSNVGKRYRRYGHDRPLTLKEAVLHGFRGMRAQRFWALRELSIDVSRGAAVGVIGPNGAGKSTLLRLIAAVERPDEGTLSVSGRVGALLEIGASFHPELSGRENAILAGVVAGLTRRDVLARLPDVVAFAGLEEFIDSPLRMYSTGMAARLAFSIASHIDPDVLLIDEALSVGDLAFQQRCMDRIREFQRAGTTIVIVSHDPNRIRELCDEVVWLRGGRLVAQGSPSEITARYVASQLEQVKEHTPIDAPVEYTAGGVPLQIRENRFGSLEATIIGVQVLDGWGEPRSVISSGAPCTVTIDVSIPSDVGPVMVGTTLRRADDLPCLDTSTALDAGAQRARVRLEISRLDVAGGEYAFDVGLYSEDWTRTFDYHYRAYPISIEGPPGGEGLLAPPLQWSVQVEAIEEATPG